MPSYNPDDVLGHRTYTELNHPTPPKDTRLLSALKRKLELRRCALDKVYFISTYCKTFDPRLALEGGSVQPFVLRPKQVEMVKWVDNLQHTKQNGIIEKSRDMGMSYTICAYYLHSWLFVEGFAGGIGSYKGEYVDLAGNSKTLFYKIRFMLYRLPDWFMPKGFKRRIHDNHARLLNPVNNSTITGEAGDNIGRGDRTTIFFIDEWAKVANQEEVNAAISATTNCVIKGSTPHGMGDLLYQERMSGRYKLFRMHWKDDPTKAIVEFDEDGVAFYPYERDLKAKHTPRVIRQEYEIDYTASAKGILINAAHIEAALNLRLDYGYPNRSALDVAEDAATGDATIYGNRAGGMVTRLEELTGEVDYPDKIAVEYAYEDEAKEFYYDAVAVGNAITATIKRDEHQHPFKVVGLKNSYGASDRVFEDNDELTCAERFTNSGSENWWALRIRFEKTYNYVHEGMEYPHDELISIPNIPDLIAQLSQPIYKKNSTGKVMVNKYGTGGKSPDYAETLMMLYGWVDPAHMGDETATNLSLGGGVKENDAEVYR